MNRRADDIIEDVIRAEGGYSDNKNDAGGKTMYGITEEVARENGYTGEMHLLPIEFARNVYRLRYVIEPGFDRVLDIMPEVGAELIDTGVNMGQQVAGEFFQACLNAFNLRGKHYPDLKVDGGVGPKTIDAARAYKALRGKDADVVMLKALNCLQGARYLLITERNDKNEDFVFGWIRARVSL